MPSLIYVAGPRLLRDEFGVLDFVNADAIAAGLSAFNPEGVAFQAGRILLQRVETLAGEGRDFAVETTLAGRAYLSSVRRLKSQGYRFHLLFLSLPSEEMAVERVAARVRLGGHNIPEATIRRRFRAGLRNFFRLYRAEADGWKLYDNSRGRPLLLRPESSPFQELEQQWS